jgi:type I restriction enzyme S subunit
MAWPVVSIGDLCDIVSGATPKTNVAAYWDGDVRWATPRDLGVLNSSYVENTPRRITEAGLRSCAATVLPANSVLLSSRAPIGLVAINRVPMATNQGFKSLVPREGRVDPKYLYHWLLANRSYLDSLGNGATFKEISKAVVARVQIPLPPIEEQQRIGDVLDRAETLRAKRHETLALLDDLSQSIFLDMFGDPTVGRTTFPVGTIGDLLESAQYGTSVKAGATGSYPILRMGNVTYDGKIDLTDLKYIDLSPREESKYLVREGDVLFNRTNSAELVGKCAVYQGREPMAYAGYLVRLRMKPANAPEYVAAFLNCNYGKTVLRGMAKSIVGMANINAKEVQSIKIGVPPTPLQIKFAERVASVGDARRAHLLDLAALDLLFASLRQRAFVGGL